jgi:hypothetical protein
MCKTSSALPIEASANRLSVATVPGVPYVLWRNAGFTALRTVKELEKVDPRYDPTVTPLPHPSEAPTPTPASYTDAVALRRPARRAEAGGFRSVADFYEAYKSGKTTPSEVVEGILPLIRRDVEKREVHSTAWVDSKVELVRAAAEASTRRWREGRQLGVLDGVPFGVKDDVSVKGYARYIGTKRDYNDGKEMETSWCVRKIEEQGAVLVGKLNMHELGMGKLAWYPCGVA